MPHAPCFILLAATALGLLAGERPYEMVWANRTRDDHPALIPFTDAAGWRVETAGAEARLERSQDVLLFGDAVVKLTHRGTGKNPRVLLYPPAPLAITGAFDAVTCWVYGDNLRYAPDPRKPPVDIALNFSDSAGQPFSVPLARVDFKEWFLCHRRLTPEQIGRVSHGAKLLSITVANGRNPEDRSIYLNSLAVFLEPFPPLTFDPRPQRGVRIFPACKPGTNTGPGTLPFPNTPLTIVPRDSSPSVVRVARSSTGHFLFVRDGEDGRLEVRLPLRAGDWDDLAMRWADSGQAWVATGLGGGLYFAPERADGAPARATAEEVSVTTDGKSVTFSGRLFCGNRSAAVNLRCHLIGKSLVMDVQAGDGQIQECRFGATRGFLNPRSVPLPYYTYNEPEHSGQRPVVLVSGPADSPLFFMAHLDWTQSNASAPFTDGPRLDDALSSNGGTRYLAKTDGTRNPCFERFVYTLSPKFEDVLPNIPNPVSPWKAVTGTRVWRSHAAGDRARDAAHWREMHRWGLTQLVITDHETGWRDGNESFTFRTEPAPRKGGDEGQRAYARIMQDELGFVYGPYNNFTDFAPVNGFWNIDLVSRRPDSQLQHAWERCYAPKPARAVEFCERLAPVIEKKFGFSTAYCDVHTAVTPWSRADFDSRVPGAGTFAAVFYAYGEIMLLQKAAWGGPVYSEGNAHFPYCGLTDGNYAQDQTYRFHENPWLADFDLRRLHDLCCNFGMGEPGMFYPGGSAPEDADTAADRFLAATVAFGHSGFLLSRRELALRSYYMLQALASLYTQSAADTIRYVDASGEAHDTSAALGNGAYARSQIVTRYADGTVTAANGNTREPLRTVLGETVLDLPPNGYWGRSPDGAVRVFSGAVNGHRADLSVAPGHTYIDGRGTFVRFPEGACAGVAICRGLTNGLAEILLHKTGEAGFPFTLTEAVALSQDNRVLGPAEVRVSRGLSYVQPVPGAFSYRVRKAPQQPVSPLACDAAEAAPGESLTVCGSAAHTVTIPVDAKPGARVWRSFEGAWIDFTVVEPVTLSGTVENGTLVIRAVSRLSAARRVALQCEKVEHPFTLEPGANAPQRLPLPPGAERSGTVAFSLLFSDGSGLAPVTRTLARQSWRSERRLPTQRAAGMRLRGAGEVPLAATAGARLHTGTLVCGGTAKSGALFMHPPYQGGTGYAFARYTVSVPNKPTAFRCAVGKQDGSALGDGILFRAVVEDGQGERTEIASRTVTAHAWYELEGSLARWAGKTVGLLLVTDPGEKDDSSGDWGAWADPRLEDTVPVTVWTQRD